MNRDKENDRPRYTTYVQADQEGRALFVSIEEASEYWRDLWEKEGTGDRRAAWLEEIRCAIESRVPPPPEERWDLEPAGAVRVIVKKKNWSAPSPDRLVNFWWKHAHSLHECVASALQAISSSDEEYPQWFSKEKASLIPKPREFTSDNQRPITCLNTIYKWYTSCLLAPIDKHLNYYGLIEGAQGGCSRWMQRDG